MQPQFPPEVGSEIVALPANGMTATAEELRNQLVCAGRTEGTIVIDGSAVQTVGQAVLQLLVATQRDALATGGSCRIVNASAALRDAVAACRLTAAIELEAGADTE
jgi:anti-anti-sigma regulatory factor